MRAMHELTDPGRPPGPALDAEQRDPERPAPSHQAPARETPAPPRQRPNPDAAPEPDPMRADGEGAGPGQASAREGSGERVSPASDADAAGATLDDLMAEARRPARQGAALHVIAGVLWAPQAAVLAAGLATLAPAALGGAADRGPDAPSWAVDPALGPLTAALLFVAIAALRAGLDAWAGARSGRAGDIAAAALRRRLADRAAAWAPIGAASAPSSAPATARAAPPPGAPIPAAGRVASLAADAAEALSAYAAGYVPARAKLMTQPLAFLILIALVSWPAALVLLLVGAATPLLMARIGRAARAASDRQLAEIGSMNAVLLDRLRTLPDLRLIGAADRAAAGLASAAQTVRDRTMAVLRVAFLTSGALEICASIAFAAVAILMAVSISGDAAGGLAAPFWGAAFVLLLTPEFFTPFREFAGAYHDRAGALSLAQAVAGLERVAAPRMIGDGAAAAPLAPASPSAPALRLERAGLRAGPDRWAVRDVDLEVAIGEKLALVGPSGSGKTMLMALAAGLAAPDAGAVSVLGRPLDAETADAWRARIAWIGQKPHFLAASLRANIAFYAPDAVRNEQAVADAVRQAAAQEIVQRALGGADAPLGETGAGVSGGEARRLAVARLALARRVAGRDVILADEPTADLDPETAAAVIDGLFEVADGATLIVATHDRALAARADRQVRLVPTGAAL